VDLKGKVTGESGRTTFHSKPESSQSAKKKSKTREGRQTRMDVGLVLEKRGGWCPFSLGLREGGIRAREEMSSRRTIEIIERLGMIILRVPQTWGGGSKDKGINLTSVHGGT